MGHMPALLCSGYRLPSDIIQHVVWMYLRFTLSFRDVEEPLGERGITVTCESIRRWVLTFGSGNRPKAAGEAPETARATASG
jgi:transposase-like protein